MKKILILSLEAGHGHIKVAEALLESFKLRTDIETKHVNVTEYSTKLTKLLYSNSYTAIVKNIPDVYGFLYRKYSSIKKITKPLGLFDRLSSRKFLNLLEEYNPDLVVSTHPTVTLIISDFKKRNGKNWKTAVVVTDYEIHPLWLAENIDLYAVANAEVEGALRNYGFKSKVVVSGIPVAGKFSSPKERGDLFKKFGLDPLRPVILLMAGSFGVTPVGEILDEIKNLKKDFQILVVCGNDRTLCRKITQKQKSDPRIKHVFGFSDSMEELMALSTLIVTKPGGITVSESLAMNLPMILVEPIPGQEEANADYLLEKGAAIKARSLPSLIYKLEDLLDHPEKLESLKKNMRAIAKPRAAETVVEEALKLVY